MVYIYNPLLWQTGSVGMGLCDAFLAGGCEDWGAWRRVPRTQSTALVGFLFVSIASRCNVNTKCYMYLSINW